MHRRALGCTSYLPWPLVTSWLYMYYLPLLVLQHLHGVLQLLHACTTISGWITSISLYVCKWKSHRTLAMLFSTNFGDVSHWESICGTDVSAHYPSHLPLSIDGTSHTGAWSSISFFSCSYSSSFFRHSWSC